MNDLSHFSRKHLVKSNLSNSSRNFKVKHLPKLCIIICFSDNSSKMIKNAFCFILKALPILKMFKFLSWLFGDLEKNDLYKDKVNFEIYDVTAWLAKNYNTLIAQYLTNESQPDNEIWSIKEVWYSCIAHCSAHLFIIEISSHNHI